MYVLPYSLFSYGTVRKNSSFMFCMVSQIALHLRLICIMFPFQHFLLNMATEVINGQVPETVAGGDIAPKKPVNKKLTVEKIYQKKSQLEHILLRPDTYIGKQLTV